MKTMKNYKAIIGIYGKANNLLGLFEDHIRATNQKQARKLANETRQLLSKEYERKATLLSVTLTKEIMQVSKLPF